MIKHIPMNKRKLAMDEVEDIRNIEDDDHEIMESSRREEIATWDIAENKAQ